MTEGSRQSDAARRGRQAGVAGAVVGVAAAGVAAGVAVERFLLRRSQDRATDPYAEEHFGQLPYDESMMVSTPSGVDVYVEVVEPADGVDIGLDGFSAADERADEEPTLVFIHGFALDMGTFHFQRKELARRGDYRMVFYDQPGHGRSGRRQHGEYSLEDLADTLLAVLAETAAAGPLVLIGHSMGGMAIMALAEQHPEMFGDRIKGVVLLSTSAGQMDEVNFGLPQVLARFRKPLLPLAANASRITVSVLDRARQASSDLTYLMTRKYGFGPGRPSPAVVSYVERMNSSTSTEVLARYLRTIYSHARFPALEALKRVEVLAICGDRDTLTPLEHSEAIAEALPHADLVVIHDGGHVALLEYPNAVNGVLLDFLEKIG